MHDTQPPVLEIKEFERKEHENINQAIITTDEPKINAMNQLTKQVCEPESLSPISFLDLVRHKNFLMQY